MTEAFSFAPGLTVCVDFKSPQSYLASEPICRLIDELGIVADWQPVLVPPLKRPPAARPDDDRGIRHRRARALYVEHDIRRYARSRGLTVADPYLDPDSSIAAMGLLWCKAKAPDTVRRYVDLVFEGLWERRHDLAERETVAELLAAAGAPTAGWDSFAASPGRLQLDHLQAGLAGAGVFLAPALVVRLGDADPEMFLGRAHLPMVRWLLTDKRGVAPI